MANIPTIREFKELGPGDWRIDWLGSIEHDPDVPTERKVRVVLSRIRDNWSGTDVSSNEAVDHSTRTVVPVGVGQLPYFGLGTVWRNGKLLPIRPGTIVKFPLEINAENVGRALATQEVEGRALVPYSSHRILKEGIPSKCTYVSFNGDPAGIIIPDMELIRFYLATSTRLSKAVFDGDFLLNESSIYDPEFTGMDGDRFVINRRMDVSGDDCKIIGRIYNSYDASRAVKMVWDSMVESRANGLPVHPATCFPFSGKTTLRALCKQVGGKHKRWLVLSLISCSGPLPYSELLVIPDNDGSSADPDTDISDDEKIESWKTARKHIDPSVPPEIQSQQEPSANTERITFDIPEERFTALAGIKILERTKEQCHYKSGALKKSVDASDANSFGTGDGTHGKTDAAAADVKVTRPRQGLPASFTTLTEMLDCLNSYPGVNARLYPFLDSEGLIEARRTRPSHLPQWGYLDYGLRLLRRIMVAEVRYCGRFYYLVEVERRPNTTEHYLAELVCLPEARAISPGTLRNLADNLSRVKGRMVNLKALPDDLQRLGTGLKHTWESAKAYADSVASKITEHEINSP